MSVLLSKDLMDRLLLNLEDGGISVSPCINLGDVLPSSINLHLGELIKNTNNEILTHLNEENYYILKPNEFILGNTYEHIAIPNDLVGKIINNGLANITLYITEQWINPSSTGKIIIGIKNLGNEPVILTYNMNICQIIFLTITTPQYQFNNFKLQGRKD